MASPVRIVSGENEAISISNPLPTNVTNGFSLPEFDEIDLGYTGDDLTSVVYKLGGLTVATLTLVYTDGKLTGVTKS